VSLRNSSLPRGHLPVFDCCSGTSIADSLLLIIVPWRIGFSDLFPFKLILKLESYRIWGIKSIKLFQWIGTVLQYQCSSRLPSEIGIVTCHEPLDLKTWNASDRNKSPPNLADIQQTKEVRSYVHRRQHRRIIYMRIVMDVAFSLCP
jgi:hypothetical protein